jgi:hypothetical protein
LDAFHRTGRHAQAALGRATQRNVPGFLPDTSREAAQRLDMTKCEP